MVPNFALSLSFEGIALLRRMGDVWARIQDVAFDGGDLDAAMSDLRETAAALDPKGTDVVLLIPNEQIRYMDLPDPGGDEVSREIAIRAGLDGATPYEVKDLTFDYTLSQGHVQVAAVANDTLDEAQAFAKAHGFTPISYAAQAPDGAFKGAVFFGKAKGWRRAARRLPHAVTIVPADEAARTPVKAAKAEAEAPQMALALDEQAEAEAGQQPDSAVDKDATDAKPTPAGTVDAAIAAAAVASAAASDPRAAGVMDESEDMDADARPDSPSPAPSSVETADPSTPAIDTDAPGHDDEPEPTEEEARAQRKARRAERRARQKSDAAPEDKTQGADPSIAPGSDDAGTLPYAAETQDGSDALAPDAGVDSADVADALPGQDDPDDVNPPVAPELPKPGKAPALSGVTAEEREAAAAVPVSFSTIRASRTDASSAIPPAPRALKLGEDDGSVAKVAPRFHPVLQDRAKADADTVQGADETVSPPAEQQAIDEPKTEAIPEQTAKAKRRKADGAAAKGLLAGSGQRLKRGLQKARQKKKPAGDETLVPAPDPSPAKTAPGKPVRDPAAPVAPAVAAQAASIDAAPAPSVKSPSPLSRLAALRAEAAPTDAPKPAGAGLKEPPRAEPRTAANSTLARLSKARQKQEKSAKGGAVALDERERMTVFGMRQEQKIGGKPRFLGLMLTAALLLFLIGVAAWASVFLDDGLASLFRREEPTAVAALPEPVAQPGPEALPEEVISAPEAVQAPAAVEPEVEIAALETEPPAADLPPARAVPSAPRVLTPEEATATYAATGIWQRTPSAPLQPPADGVDDIYVASIDPAVQQFDAVALPSARQLARDAALEDPGLPPPAGMVFDFDERGLIRATPEGALSPEGLRIYTGRPPVVPPLRSAALTPSPDIRSDAAVGAEPDPLASFRPEARPDDIVEQRERATLGGISREELAALRPVQRPKTVQEEAVEAAPEEPATAQAVTASLVPLARPRNMEAIVRRAERSRPAEPVQQAAAVARPLAPSGPTATSVARAATDANAINLSRINLIGVYGTPSNRRALVRLPGSGKYEKVKIGDRLDGGRVQSITDEALVYVKGGRSITLKMPRG
mgnify:CR=1 FL=1